MSDQEDKPKGVELPADEEDDYEENYDDDEDQQEEAPAVEQSKPEPEV